MNLDRRGFLAAGATGLAAPVILSATAAPSFATASAPRTNPLYSRRRIGAFEVTALLDGTLPVEREMIIGFDEAAATSAYARQHLPGPTGAMPIPILGYVVDTGTSKIAIDAGTVQGFAPTLGGYSTALAQAGFNASDIDMVLLTHLHPDHVGAMVADGARGFENAEIYVDEIELGFWQNTTPPEGFEPFFNIARASVAPYDGRIKTFKGDTELATGIQAVALPGHTPGHSGFRFHSEGQDILFWGDIIHLTKLQFDNPGWILPFDMDPETTMKTRNKMLDMAATDGLLVAGAHVDFPGAGFVEKAGDAYRFVTAPHDYLG